MTVYIDGSTLSALLFSHFNSSGNQYGILLGKRVEEIEERISDSQIHTSNVTSYTNISSFVPWHSSDHVYSRRGEINEDLLEQLITPSSEQELIGWYSFRHQTSMRPSLKESSLHQSLLSCSKFEGDPKDFYFLLCTSSIPKNGSTHTCNHGFYSFVNGSFLHVPMSVMNLGDTTRTEYRKQSNVTLTHSSAISNVFINHRKDFVHSSGQMDQVVKVEKLSENMKQSLKGVYKKVRESEAVLGLLELDVYNLMERLSVYEQDEMVRIFQEEENKRKELEKKAQEMEKKMEVEEKAELDKLIVDLGLNGSVELPESPAPESLQGFSFVDLNSDSNGAASINDVDQDFESYAFVPEAVHLKEGPSPNESAVKKVTEPLSRRAVDPSMPSSSKTQDKPKKEDPFAEVVRLEKASLSLKTNRVAEGKQQNSMGKINNSAGSDASSTRKRESGVSKAKLSILSNSHASSALKPEVPNGNVSNQNIIESDTDTEMDNVTDHSINFALETLPSSSPVF